MTNGYVQQKQILGPNIKSPTVWDVILLYCLYLIYNIEAGEQTRATTNDYFHHHNINLLK